MKKDEKEGTPVFLRKTLNLLSWKGYRDTPYFKKSFTKKA